MFISEGERLLGATEQKKHEGMNAGAILDASVMSESVNQMQSVADITHFGSIHHDGIDENAANKTTTIGIRESLNDEKKGDGDEESFIDETNQGAGNIMQRVKEENRKR